MPKLNIINQSGVEVGSIELSDYVFGITPHQQAIFDVATAQRAAKRQGTSAVKNRSEVAGGGKKPWRQKGTGRARQGSIRSPQWRGGGVVFGPTQRSYAVKINKKVRNLAFRSVLSSFLIDNKLTIVDNLNSENGKTKEFNAVLNNLNLSGKTLIISTNFGGNEFRAARNIPTVTMADPKHVSVLDMVSARNLVITEDAAKVLQEALGNE